MDFNFIYVIMENTFKSSNEPSDSIVETENVQEEIRSNKKENRGSSQILD